ncbi:unnamed protein product [Moneuplotes crassus]|uniref:Far11/STRP C-terminal domain-containing protein n=2 Tax=Euplotes crassus TaxID=5936 RepID=A0AAD1YCW9_EUPCR|nr:unnamed protein product [Moneuplotes crassus]
MEESVLNAFKEISQREYLNSFFSYSETVDIYHTILLLKNQYANTEESPEEGKIGEPVTINNKKNYITPKFEGIYMIFETKQVLFTFIEKCQEGLEIHGLPQKQSLYSLFLLQMGLYIIKQDDDLDDSFIPFDIEDETRLVKSMYISRLLTSLSLPPPSLSTASSFHTLLSFSQTLTAYTHKLSTLDTSLLQSDPNSFLDLEFETKVSLNNLFLLIMNNYDSPEMKQEIAKPVYRLERNSFVVIRLSLELPIGPIRKSLIMFYLYMNSLFGDLEIPPNESEEDSKGYVKITPRLMDFVEVHRNLDSGNPVENFYKKHIVNVKDNPIPQILVVAILRILLTTCPNANRSSGGIDLHREWISSISLLVKYPEIYSIFIENKADDCPLIHNRIISLYSNKEESKEENKDRDNSDDSEKESNSEEDQDSNKSKDSSNEEDTKYFKLFAEGELDLAVSDLFNFENYRHSMISAKFIGQLLLFIQRKFQYNHVIQGVYFSSLIVDANGIKVLLKFLNQNFHGSSNYLLRRSDALSIICADILPSLKEGTLENIHPSQSSQIEAYNDEIFSRVKYVIHNTIRPVLYLMHAVSFGQYERIEQNLIGYKAIKIMSRIAENFSDTDNKTIAYQIIKIQIQYIKDKGMKSNSSNNIMKAISKVYENIRLEKDDIGDWIKLAEDTDYETEELNHKELADVNKEFHLRYYWNTSAHFQDQPGEDDSSDTESSKRKPLVKTLKLKNEYYKLMLQAEELTDDQKENYMNYL